MTDRQDLAGEGGVDFAVDEQRCIRCGACALTAPDVFEVTADRSRVRRQPAGDAETRSARAAQLICPTFAIKTRAAAGAAPPVGESEGPRSESSPLFPRLARQSEEVRWHLNSIDWSRLEPALAPPPVRTLVREMAFSEHATYSATQRFMQTFGDDVDFTQWLSIWFYEETRHPHALMEWLRAIGETLEDSFVLQGRVSTPFMRSKMGTLVTNIVSEVTAATAYGAMGRAAREPVLAQVGRFIAGDEARHASTFFQFARLRLETAADPERERLDALKVLHFWLNETQQVSHPINQMLERVRTETAEDDALRLVTFDFAAMKRRITRLVAILIDLDLTAPEDVLPALKTMTSDLHARRRRDDGASTPWPGD